MYRYPLSNWRYKQRFGGYLSYKKMMKGRQGMINASTQLPPIISDPTGLSIYFLTGKKYLFQTLFCAYSLIKVTNQRIQFTLVDDGSFNDKLVKQVKEQMPNVRLVLKNEIDKNLATILPVSKYPYLHHKRKVYPHIKKLTDIHTIEPKTVKLVLDSDMLFWNEPIEIIEWLKNPNSALYMLDCEESYGYDTDLMQSLCYFKIPPLMNVGTFGLNSNIINWENLEHWAKTLEEKQGPSYFLEQALSAMLVAKESRYTLCKEKYIVNPLEEAGVNSSDIILHHYVDLSKKNYFEKAWRKLIHD